MIVKQNSWLLWRLCDGSANWYNPPGKQSDRRRIWTHGNVQPFDPAVPLLGINLKEIIQQKRVSCMKIATSVLSVTAKIRNHLSVQGRLSKLQLINSIERRRTSENWRPSKDTERLVVQWQAGLWENVRWQMQAVRTVCALWEKPKPVWTRMGQAGGTRISRALTLTKDGGVTLVTLLSTWEQMVAQDHPHHGLVTQFGIYSRKKQGHS